MMSRLSITLFLIGVGALGGALCGLVYAIPHGVWLSPCDDVMCGPSDWIIAGSILGGIFGAVFGPTLGWGLLRRVPLWRVALQPTAGAIIGALVALAVEHSHLLPGRFGETVVLWGPAASACLAAVILNRQNRRATSARSS